ncbi:MAG: VWA domain-containing protein [Acidimicrobiia bacterium]|nr:VWA domain-containing protein [Acidimicrobiia bacterium]NNL29219.1 VWA domain-containing protein [Acidimicrobiia bacterium]
MTAIALPAEVFVKFTRRLREEGLRSVPETSADLLAAVQAPGLSSGIDNYYAMRAVAVRRPEEMDIFNTVFMEFFGSGKIPEIVTEEQLIELQPTMRAAAGEGADDDDEAEAEAGASYAERLAHRDFLEMSDAEWAEAQRMIQQMRFQSTEALSHRWRPDRRGKRPDLRRVLRNMTRPDGELLRLELQSRKHRRRPLLILADVSGSMERYTEAFLYFTHAIRRRLGRVEVFVFSTRLTRITRELTHQDPYQALTLVSDNVEDWSGGTRIGETFETFNRVWSRRVTRGGPICMVLSDGWDCGEPETLAAATSQLSRSVHSLLWLNPLSGREGYQPSTRGMRAALPFIDQLVPAATIHDLSSIIQLIESIPSHAVARSVRPA